MDIDINKLQEIQKFSKELKVLYVEDNEEARSSTFDTLSEFFEDIETAENGLEALGKFENTMYDLIITDINMPKMNGIDMVAKIRETNTHIPILIISAYSDSGYFMETIRLGVEGYLLKPIELQQFISMVSKTVEKIKMRKELERYHKYLEESNINLNKDLKEQRYKDHLTGLFNRFALEERIFQNLDKFITLYLIDINNFRKLNEMYGFEKGNEILVKFGSAMKESFEDKTSLELFKISADEFALVEFNKEYDLQNACNTAKSILEKVDNQNITLNDGEIIINITIGLAIDKEDVLTRASSALDMAKLKNKKYLLYNDNEKFENELKNLFHWQKEIKFALDNDNIIPYFQPIFNQEKQIVKYEVLMRMKKEENGQIKYISPFFFLDISIKTKQYDRLSETIIRKTIDISKLNKDIFFSINLGYRDMSNENVKNMLREYIQENKKNNIQCNLIFEIVESEDIQDYSAVKEFFCDLGCENIKIAIDDFGSGYSNFYHILEIMPEYLKIDGSLIKDIDKNENMLTLTRAIISFAKKLEIKTIAEFVHSSEIFEILKKEGVDEFQGFYLGEPAEYFKQG